MTDNENTRYVEVLKHGKWVPFNFMSMEVGDIFRMFEEDSTPVKDEKGNTEFKVKEKPFIRNDGVYAVEVE